MRTFFTYLLSLSVSALFACLLAVGGVQAQEVDTTKIELKKDREGEQTINLNQNYDRSVSAGSMTEMGTYSMPSEKQYYQHPFKGQYYLDMAVEAYREQLREQVGDNWYWSFLKAVSPYIRLEMGAFQTLEMQYVGRDNPLFQNYKSDEKLK